MMTEGFECVCVCAFVCICVFVCKGYCEDISCNSESDLGTVQVDVVANQMLKGLDAICIQTVPLSHP